MKIPRDREEAFSSKDLSVKFFDLARSVGQLWSVLPQESLILCSVSRKLVDIPEEG